LDSKVIEESNENSTDDSEPKLKISTSTLMIPLPEETVEPKLKVAIIEFNKNWSMGVQYLMDNDIATDPKSIASFLMEYNNQLSKEQLGQLLGGKAVHCTGIRTAFTKLFDFRGDKLDTALRKYLTKFMIPGEAQVIDRIIESFAEKYVHDNSGGPYINKDAAFTMAFSLVILNTDRHSPQIPDSQKMTLPQFFKNNSGLWEGNDPPVDLQEELFNSIVDEEIVIKKQGDPDKRGWAKGIRGQLYEQGRRWLVLKGNELRWYKSPNQCEDKGLLGKIVLDYVRILEDIASASLTILSVVPIRLFKIFIMIEGNPVKSIVGSYCFILKMNINLCSGHLKLGVM